MVDGFQPNRVIDATKVLASLQLFKEKALKDDLENAKIKLASDERALRKANFGGIADTILGFFNGTVTVEVLTGALSELAKIQTELNTIREHETAF